MSVAGAFVPEADVCAALLSLQAEWGPLHLPGRPDIVNYSQVFDISFVRRVRAGQRRRCATSRLVAHNPDLARGGGATLHPPLVCAPQR